MLCPWLSVARPLSSGLSLHLPGVLGAVCGSHAAQASCVRDFGFSLLKLDTPPSPRPHFPLFLPWLF